MVGKPNFPTDVDDRTDLVGLATPTPGLNALDQEREGSMADEGGTSGAVMETQSRGDVSPRAPTSNRPYADPTAALVTAHVRRTWIALGVGTLGVALIAFGLWRNARA